MMRNSRIRVRTFWGVSIILIEAVVVIFVFYILYFFWIENPTPTSNILIVKAFQKQSVQIPESVNTHGWQEYLDGQYGYSFMYPAGYIPVQDEIAYGDNSGELIMLQRDGEENFSLRIFQSPGDETVPEAFQRLTNIDPVIYQSYSETVDSQKATIYRQKPGESSGDMIYFKANEYFFEASFNTFSAEILSTFKFF